MLMSHMVPSASASLGQHVSSRAEGKANCPNCRHGTDLVFAHWCWDQSVGMSSTSIESCISFGNHNLHVLRHICPTKTSSRKDQRSFAGKYKYQLTVQSSLSQHRPIKLKPTRQLPATPAAHTRTAPGLEWVFIGECIVPHAAEQLLGSAASDEVHFVQQCRVDGLERPLPSRAAGIGAASATCLHRRCKV